MANMTPDALHHLAFAILGVSEALDETRDDQSLRNAIASGLAALRANGFHVPECRHTAEYVAFFERLGIIGKGDWKC